MGHRDILQRTEEPPQDQIFCRRNGEYSDDTDLDITVELSDIEIPQGDLKVWMEPVKHDSGSQGMSISEVRAEQLPE